MEIRAMAFALYHNNVRDGVVVWMQETEEWLYWHVVYQTVDQVEGLLDDLESQYRRHGIENDSDIPLTAVPVFRVMERGELMRFWSPPGPRLPERHQVDVEGTIIVFHERCFAID